MFKEDKAVEGLGKSRRRASRGAQALLRWSGLCHGIAVALAVLLLLAGAVVTAFEPEEAGWQKLMCFVLVGALPATVAYLAGWLAASLLKAARPIYDLVAGVLGSFFGLAYAVACRAGKKWLIRPGAALLRRAAVGSLAAVVSCRRTRSWASSLMWCHGEIATRTIGEVFGKIGRFGKRRAVSTPVGSGTRALVAGAGPRLGHRFDRGRRYCTMVATFPVRLAAQTLLRVIPSASYERAQEPAPGSAWTSIA